MSAYLSIVPEPPAQPALVARRTIFRLGDSAIPVPPALQRYVRSEEHFAAVLRTLAIRLGGRHGAASRCYYADRLQCAQHVVQLLSNNLNDPLASRLILLLFPPQPCAYCRRPFLRESRVRRHCGRACCRRAAEAGAKAKAKAGRV